MRRILSTLLGGKQLYVGKNNGLPATVVRIACRPPVLSGLPPVEEEARLGHPPPPADCLVRILLQLGTRRGRLGSPGEEGRRRERGDHCQTLSSIAESSEEQLISTHGHLVAHPSPHQVDDYTGCVWYVGERP